MKTRRLLRTLNYTRYMDMGSSYMTHVEKDRAPICVLEDQLHVIGSLFVWPWLYYYNHGYYLQSECGQLTSTSITSSSRHYNVGGTDLHVYACMRVSVLLSSFYIEHLLIGSKNSTSLIMSTFSPIHKLPGLYFIYGWI